MEEPPSKLIKFEMESQYLEGEAMDDGQEEWLSEGILTDDDYNPSQTELDLSDSNVNMNMSQDDTMASISTQQSQESQHSQNDDETIQNNLDGKQNILDHSQNSITDTINTQMESTETKDGNIEEVLNNLENSQNNYQCQDLPDELETFLIRKTDKTPNNESDVEDTGKQSDDDGNDTDDLLRVLGDGDQKKDKRERDNKRERQNEKGDDSSDEDGYIFEQRSKTKTYKIAKLALMRSAAKKAEPEDDITDCSSDEANIKRMFAQSNLEQKAAAEAENQVKKEKPIKKQIVTVQHRPKTVQTRPTSTPMKQYTNRKVQGASLLKSATAVEKKPKVEEGELGEEADDEKKVAGGKSSAIQPQSLLKQRLMKPEVMDEEVPTDPESDSDEESIYDELPSSDSDNVDDWFTLDIRAERAGDYLPLLGARAHQLLSEEKRRVQGRLESLKRDMSALLDSAHAQADALRDATATLAELDTMLRAA